MSINDYKFDDVRLVSHGDTYDSNAKTNELDRIPSHVRSIKELLYNKEKL